MSDATNAQADALTALAGIAGSSAAQEVGKPEGDATNSKPVEKKAKVKLTVQERIVKLREQAQKLLDEASELENAEKAASQYELVNRGWKVQIKVGRADTRRTITGKVVFREQEGDLTYVKVLEAKENGDVELYRVQLREIVSAEAPAGVV